MTPSKPYPPVYEVVLGVYVNAGGFSDCLRVYWDGEFWWSLDRINGDCRIPAPDHWRA